MYLKKTLKTYSREIRISINLSYKYNGIKSFGIMLRTIEVIEIEKFETKIGTRDMSKIQNRKFKAYDARLKISLPISLRTLKIFQ
jgi:hypothetical protein